MRPTDDDDSAYFCSTMNSRNRNNWIRKFKVREISTLCGKCKAVKLAQLLLQETNWHAVDRTDMTFFTLICCKNCIVCFKRPKINEKEAFVGPFFKKRLCDQDRERDEVCIERRKDLGRFSINVKAIFEAIFQRHFPGQISTSFCQITFRHFIIFSHPELHRYPPTYHSARGKYLSRKTDRPGFVTARGRPLSWTRNGWFC